MEIQLSVVIPHHKDESYLELLLESIANQASELEIEVIVISNPPSKEAELICLKHPRTIHIQSGSIGVNKARNLGIKKSRGQLLMFVDSDCEMLDTRLIQKHWNMHEKYKDFACIGGQYRCTSSKNVDQAYSYNQIRWLYQGLRNEQSQYLIGGHFSCKKAFLEDFKFDENIIYGASETEFFFRIGLFQKKLKLIPELEIHHSPQMNYFKLVKKLYRQGFGTKYVENKLGFVIRNSPVNFKTFDLDRNQYSKKFDLPLEIMQKSFDSGFSAKDSKCSSLRAAAICAKCIFYFSKKRISEFINFLELFLKNFPKE